VSDSTNNTIGGDAAESRNLISGNGQGVQVSSSLSGRATGNIVRGNYIGTDITGSASLGNTISGVLIDGAANSIIGGETSTSRNVVSGNGSHGVCLLTSAAKGNVVEGNFIGIDATGTRKLPNRMEGVAVLGGSSNIIGGTTAGSGNVISGNGRHGVSLHDAQNVVQGNYIGTDVTGTIALGNSGVGVDVTAAWGNTIGGTVSEARNVISANATGVALGLRSSHGNVVQGNLIGTDVTGTTVLGNTVDGLIVHSDAYGNTIGGTAAGARNVISGNGRYGAHIGGEHTEQNVVQGNYIGTDLASAVALGNGSDGVHLAYGTFNNTIGGASEGAVNTIAFNGGDGVSVESGTGNTILSNRIFLNTDLGIDLGPGGVTPNDPYDADLGANNLQNFPVLTSAAPNGGNTAIAGSINSTSGTAFRIEFFSSGTCDPSGHGEGRDLLGSTAVTTDASGDADIAVTFPIVIPVGQFITATATDPNDNSSEFSRCIVVDADIDADGCSYAEETAGAHHPKPGSTCTGSTGAYDPLAWYDFYDVPVPAYPDPAPNGTRNQAVNVQDVVGVLKYAGTQNDGPPNGYGVDYDSDKNGDTVEDGRDYDRSPGPLPSPPWDAGAPDGAVNVQDVVTLLKQVGLDCRRP
jgi:titin